jgi:hypothetical protein
VNGVQVWIKRIKGTSKLLMKFACSPTTSWVASDVEIESCGKQSWS